ncbi:hypothetical protein CFHF_25325 [Caulobacter flavus]|uniref:Sensor histidine kinase n=1 Tax=Caulobacter flavus TaxID=1679497 RepID=A0A2N5CLB9_9CAUL|nr:hypothetical protein [Caulobacter flavus]AYV48350.1 hypothetical protein C1707_19955 [Caulobacter flavus]PLR06510.1 hypothetical protein CFHF_25325 [Caulobacter flavus]
MDKALLVQLLGSAAAVALLVGLSAWARIARPTASLDEAAARELLAQEFPDHAIEAIWIAGDGGAVIARAADAALVLWRKGDGYVARSAAWRDVVATGASEGCVRLAAVEGAPRLRLGDRIWPPAEAAA